MYKNDTVKSMMEESGRCLPLTLIGGYTLIYFSETGNVLCDECATEQAKDVTDVRTYDEGATVECTNCGKHIESSYGDPEEKREHLLSLQDNQQEEVKEEEVKNEEDQPIIKVNKEKYTIQDLKNIPENIFILADIHIESTNSIIEVKKFRAYKETIRQLNEGKSLYEAYQYVGEKGKTTWVTVQNYVYEVMLKLPELVVLAINEGVYDYNYTIECLTVENLYKDFIKGYSIPNKRTQKTKLVLYPNLKEEYRGVVTKRQSEVYSKLIDKIKQGEYIGYAIPKIVDEVGIGLTAIDNLVYTTKDILLLHFTLILTQVKIVDENEEIIEEELEEEFHEKDEYTVQVENERDYYKTRCKKLEEEVRQLHSIIQGVE